VGWLIEQPWLHVDYVFRCVLSSPRAMSNRVKDGIIVDIRSCVVHYVQSLGHCLATVRDVSMCIGLLV